MGLFDSIVRTAVNVATAPVAVAKDVVTMGGDSISGGKTYTEKKIEQIKREAKRPSYPHEEE